MFNISLIFLAKYKIFIPEFMYFFLPYGPRARLVFLALFDPLNT